MPYKIELIDLEGSVVGFFEVDPDITMSALVLKLEEAAMVEGALSAVGWQVRRPEGSILSGSILCQIKNLPQGAGV
jgi:hypothetical protein